MIDLSLARSYYPVCYAFLLTSCACASVAIFSSMQIPSFNTFVIAATLLFMDNIKRKETIFDANNLASFVLFSLVFNEERNAHVPADEGQKPVAVACNLIWMVFASLAIVKCEERMPFCRYLSVNHTAISAMMLTVHSFLYHEPEPEPVVLLSATVFVSLSVIWMYTVHVEQLMVKNVFDCVPCMVYFGPLMVIQPAVRIMFATWMSVLLFFLYRTQQQQQPTHQHATSVETTTTTLLKRGGVDDEDSDMEQQIEKTTPQHSRRKKGSCTTPRSMDTVSRFSIEESETENDDKVEAVGAAVNTSHTQDDHSETMRMFEEALRQSAGSVSMFQNSKHFV